MNVFCFCFSEYFMFTATTVEEHKAFPPSDVWVNNLSHENNVFCVTLSDDDHKWAVKLQDRDNPVGEEHDTDACSSCCCGSSLINIQGGLVYHLQRSGVRNMWEDWIKGRNVCLITLSLPLRLPVYAPLKYRSDLHYHETCLPFPFQSALCSVCRKSWWRTLAHICCIS